MSLKIIHYDVAPGAAEDATVTTQDESEFSSPDLITEGNILIPSLATGEAGAWILDGSCDILSNQQIPFWSNAMSGSDGNFSEPYPNIEVTLSDSYASVGVSLMFGDAPGDYCDAVRVTWYSNDSVIVQKTFYPDSSSYYCEKEVIGFDKILLEFISTHLPYRYVKLAGLLFGSIHTFTMEDLKSAKITQEVNLLSSELRGSTLDFTLVVDDSIEYMFQSKQTLRVFSDDNLLGVFFVDSNTRTGADDYDIRAYNAISELGNEAFAGGVYTNQSAKALIQSIIDSEFKLDFGELEDFLLTGAILPGTKREALQQILLAWGTCVSTDSVEGLRFFSPDVNATVITENETYNGATIDTATPVTQIQVTSHAYALDPNGSIEIGGNKYSDTMSVYVLNNPAVISSDKSNALEITGATLVSPSIVEAVAQRVLAYYSNRNTGKASIVWNGTKLGDYVQLPNSWDAPTTGHVLRLDLNLSNTIKADLEVR